MTDAEIKKMRLDYWDRLSFIAAYHDPETVRSELIRFFTTEFAQEIADLPDNEVLSEEKTVSTNA